MNNEAPEQDQESLIEAPERIWMHVYADADCWCSYHCEEDGQHDHTLTEFIRRVDPPAAPAPRNCVNCNHNNVDRHGICKTQTSPPNYRNVTYCGCKCVFPIDTPPAPSDERDKALAQRIVQHCASSQHGSLVDELVAALATVRAEAVKDQRDRTVEALRRLKENFIPLNRALEIVAESARTGKVEG